MSRNDERLSVAETYEVSALTDSLFDAHLAGYDAASIVDDAMVDRAYFEYSKYSIVTREWMRAALTAALTPEGT